MSHYRLSLALGEGMSVQKLAEAHKDTSQFEQGWGRMMKARPWGLSVLTKVCPIPDEECEKYQAWLKALDAHEDDVEAEALRGPAP